MIRKDKEIELFVLKIGAQYLKAPLHIRILVGKVLEGNIKIKGDEHN